MTWKPGELPQLDSPESQGLSGERLALIDAYLQGYIDQEKLAGSSFAIMRRGHLVYYKAFGEASKETNQPMQSDTIHRIYSMSKPITSVALLTLYAVSYTHLTLPTKRIV